jgi:hypothetical protein
MRLINVTECVRCAGISLRGMSTVCGLRFKRSPKGRWRICQGRIFRRPDLEDAIEVAARLGGSAAVDAMINAIMENPYGQAQPPQG